jgi:hypothetical protein
MIRTSFSAWQTFFSFETQKVLISVSAPIIPS